MSFFAALFLLLLLSGGGHHHHDHHDAPPAPELTPEQRQAQAEAALKTVRETATVLWPALSLLLWGWMWFTSGRSSGTIMGLVLNMVLLYMGYGLVIGIILLQMIVLLYDMKKADDKRDGVTS